MIKLLLQNLITTLIFIILIPIIFIKSFYDCKYYWVERNKSVNHSLCKLGYDVRYEDDYWTVWKNDIKEIMWTEGDVFKLFK